MKIALCMVTLLFACDSDKRNSAPPPTAPAADPTPPAADPTPPSIFRTDRTRACAAFADRVEPTMKNQQLDMIESVTDQCMTDARVTKENYACLMAASSGDAISECFTTKPTGPASADFESNRKAACAAYARHVISLMTADLRQTAIKTCMSDEMTEAVFDCAMQAKADDAFKRCLGLE